MLRGVAVPERSLGQSSCLNKRVGLLGSSQRSLISPQQRIVRASADPEVATDAERRPPTLRLGSEPVANPAKQKVPLSINGRKRGSRTPQKAASPVITGDHKAGTPACATKGAHLGATKGGGKKLRAGSATPSGAKVVPKAAVQIDTLPRLNGRTRPPSDSAAATGAHSSSSSSSHSAITIDVSHGSNAASTPVSSGGGASWLEQGPPCALLLGSLAAEVMQHAAGGGPSTSHSGRVDLQAIDFREAHAGTIESMYTCLCQAMQLDDALHLMKECIRANRADVLMRLKHYQFLRPAARLRSVRRALRFVQLLPRQYVDARTYNMLLSVCAEAADVRNALRSSDMLKAAGLRMDTILYTNLIKACAAAGDAEAAFAVYQEMLDGGVRMEKQVYATLVSACSEQIERTHASDRRAQLVLLERAFGVVDDMLGKRLVPDAPVWNALVTAAGRAGQLQRAFDVLDGMMNHSARPNERTFASLIDACARTGDKELAMRVYGKALREGAGGSLLVYSAAINACVRARTGADLAMAMEIYAEMQRRHVAPDSALFGALMMAAGKAGDLDLTLALQDEMRQEGLRPCAGTDSAIITCFVQHGRLAEAQAVYKRLRGAGSKPHLHAANALVNAHAKAHRLGDVVSLVCDMVAAGLQPDAFTFAGVISACQRCDECELALDVFRVMKARRVRVDEVHALLLLRMCYNRQRQGWQAGGYPPQRPGSSSPLPLPTSGRRSQERAKLLEALAPPGSKAALLREPPGEVAWQSAAFMIYREAVAAGVKPSMRCLNVMLTCLRVPWAGREEHATAEAAVVSAVTSPPHLAPELAPGRGGGGRQLPSPGINHFSNHSSISAEPEPAPVQRKIGVESVYHVQAISILEEAIVSGLVPGFTADDGSPIDLRALPPAVAEVYALTILSALQRKVDARHEVKSPVVLLVPAFDSRKVFQPSFADEAELPGATAAAAEAPCPLAVAGEGAEGGVDDSDAAFAAASRDKAPKGDERTGLGVAGVLRRLQIWAREYSPDGVIVLEQREVQRWAKQVQREAERRSASALAVPKPYGQPWAGGGLVGQQSRSIRSLGL